MNKVPAKPVDFLRFLGYGDNFEKLRFVFENDALRLKMREHFVLRIIHDVKTIYVWGFSFSKVDQPYIRKIISSNDNPQAIQWYVSIFSEADKTKALDTLLPLSIPVDNIHFKPMSDFLINPKLNIKN